MALKAGRRGLRKFEVDAFGKSKESGGAEESESAVIFTPSGSITPTYNVIRKVGKVVEVSFSVLGFSTNFGNIGTIPEGFRPKYIQNLINMYAVEDNTIQIDPNGNISTNPMYEGRDFSFHVVYLSE